MYPRFLQHIFNSELGSAVSLTGHTYKVPLVTSKVFVQLKKKSNQFSGNFTPLLPSKELPAPEGDSSVVPTDAEPTLPFLFLTPSKLPTNAAKPLNSSLQLFRPLLLNRLRKSSKILPELSFVFCFIPKLNQYIINEDNDKLIPIRLAHSVHEVHGNHGCIPLSEKALSKHEMPILHSECCLLSYLRLALTPDFS
ncbi:hypothetical protein E3N88_09382 [Mikania micrantha]|uniref:Uncharacterized protein n=1 Tax=Mikania micrantha TaxID=192012 RepID=A0A5N6PL43_9ASTR|nr:hypothetical protein E3N88_09382 [Mikania micrantha]